MKKMVVFLLVLFSGLSFAGFSARNTILYYAAPHFPPWDITTKEGSSSGINADVIRFIAKELGLRANPVKCPWKRCLLFLEEGKIDIAGTVGRTPEREKFLHFIEPPYAKAPDQVFYLPVKSVVDIQKFEDLYQFKAIGIERGARIFHRFDIDPNLKKDEITQLDQLLQMLDTDRLDVIAGNEMVLDYMINKMGLQGKYRKASYRFESNEMEYFALSRKSPHVGQIPEISRIIQKMKESGKIEEFILKYTQDQTE